MVLWAVSERGIVEGVADARRKGGVVPDFCLFYADVRFLFTDFGGFEFKAFIIFISYSSFFS